MRIQQFEQRCRRLARQAAESSAAEIEAGWQRLVHRLDQLVLAPASGAFLTRQCVERPGPHGQLSRQQGFTPGSSVEQSSR
jgi:hypothetical protein